MRSENGVVVLQDSVDQVASSTPATWAVGQLSAALEARGINASLVRRINEAPPGALPVLAAGPTAEARAALEDAGASLPDGTESLALATGRLSGRDTLLACGSDVRGLVYALLEVADRVAYAPDPLAALNALPPTSERPHNRIRSIARLFSSDIEDKGWHHNRAFWERYLTMLARERFNRFALMFGMGYDFLREVTDAYLHFAYPFLLYVPGYRVRATGLPDDERDRNLDMLRFVSDAAAERGLHFQLGLWTHGYDWSANEGVNHIIEGLTPENHSPYCRDALRMLLEACPSIGGVTFRIHGESGVPEGTYAFWKTVFDGIVACGRTVEIDMHAKGIDREMIDIALATGMPVNVSPKYWAEHMGLPYHQAAIRPQELPPPGKADEGFFAMSGGSRRFLRYGYGDLLAEDRGYGVLHRLWPGTQRLLQWGDPATAAAYSRASSFCDSVGMEVCEPLSFKGRKGSGLPGGRDAYADPALRQGDDWEKYAYTYRLWGRLLYDPDGDPAPWRRLLEAQVGPAAPDAEAALAHASRILPLITTAHLPSAANNGFWPEVYTDMPLADEEAHHYRDTPTPRRFGTVSPLDPELFSPIEAFADARLSGEPDARYSPLEVAAWLAKEARQTASHIMAARSSAAEDDPAFRRLDVDAAIQAGLGRFFAHKLRAGVLYTFFDRTGNREALREALRYYQFARDAWAELASRAEGVYVRDITFGRVPHLRGHWSDRLEAIDRDIANIESRMPGDGAAPTGASPRPEDTSLLQALLSPPERPESRVEHQPPPPFRSGDPVTVEARFDAPRPASAQLRYRRVHQAEPWQAAEMERAGDTFRTVIPAGYTDSPYPLQYHLDLRGEDGRAWLYPGFNADRTNQPYFVVRQRERKEVVA